jgi:hypothetical protein
MSDYDQIRQRVEKRYKERQGLKVHLVVYLIINLMFWILWFIISLDIPMISTALEMDASEIASFRFPWPLIIMFGWGVGLVAHYMNYRFKYGPGVAEREAAINREVEEEIARRSLNEKPKNDRRARISEDGEIQEIVDDEGDLHQRRS